MSTPDEAYLTEDEGRTLLAIGRRALEEWVERKAVLELAREFVLTDVLREPHGAFVTLRIGDELRGCIGYPENRLPLADTVRDNAINAATNDPRFEPVRPAELARIHIEVSALTPGDTPDTPFKRVHDPREIVIGRDGLCLRRPGARGGLLLPQVATAQGWDVPAFLRATCRKAGFPPEAWNDPRTEIYRFSAQVFEEER